MIIGLCAINIETNKKVYRATNELSIAKMNSYISEFVNNAGSCKDGCADVMEMDSYAYVYFKHSPILYFAQVSLDEPYNNIIDILKFISSVENTGCSVDLYDILVTFDNAINGGEFESGEMARIKAMDSQEEKIYNIMQENKLKEMRRREKEYIKNKNISINSNINANNNMNSNNISNNNNMTRASAGISNTTKSADTSSKLQKNKSIIEKSEKAILIIIKEKIKITMDYENNIIENMLSGEINMSINNAQFQSAVLKMKNMKNTPNIKFSPYLDKIALKRNIVKFEKEKGINKMIPLMKWSAKMTGLPINIDYWDDEEDGKYISMFEIKAKVDLKDLEIIFNKDDIDNIEVDDNKKDFIISASNITWNIGQLDNNTAKSTEITFTGYDSKSLFPIMVSFKSSAIESNIDIEEITVSGEKTDNYEIRKIVEVESFKIVNE